MSGTDAEAEDVVGRQTTARSGAVFERALAVVVLATVVALPLVFVPGLEDDYALPKAVALRLLGIAGTAMFVGYVLTGGPLSRDADIRVDAPVACFIGLFVAATVASVDPGQSLAGEPFQYQGLVTVLVYAGAFYAARLSLGTQAGIRAVLWALVGTGAVVATYAITQQLGFDPFWSGPPDVRAISSVGQANSLAAFLDLVVVAVLGLWTGAGRLTRPALMAVAVVAVVALGLTLSRGGWLAFGAVVAIWALAFARSASSRRRLGIAIVTTSAVLAVILVVPASRGAFERVVSRAFAMGDLTEGSVRSHLDVWRVGAQVAIDHPVLGTGPETFPIVFRPYLEQVLPPDRAAALAQFRIESPHNEVIGLAAEVGLPATVAYLVFLVACGVIAVTGVRRSRDPTGRSIALAVFSVLAVHVITTFFMTPETATSTLFWVSMGAGLAAIGMDRVSRSDHDGAL